MRKDMAKVIVDVYRSKGDGNRRKREAGCDAPCKESMRRGLSFYNKKELADRLKPFYRFLMKAEREGMFFDDVLSEVSKANGSKLMKTHLREYFAESAYKAEDGKLRLRKLF